MNPVRFHNMSLMVFALVGTILMLAPSVMLGVNADTPKYIQVQDDWQTIDPTGYGIYWS